MNWKTTVKSMLPAFMKRTLFRTGLIHEYIPSHRNVRKGDFHRLHPFNKTFGYERGLPIDRYYISHFLQSNSNFIKGNVLEIGDNYYTNTYGKENVLRSDVMHVIEGNPLATHVGDLSNDNDLPSDYFDCIILTQTLQMIFDCNKALQTCHRILKPGGCLLLTVPGVTQVDSGEWNKYWMWSFTENSIHKLCEQNFSNCKYEVEVYGNVYAATTFLYGMSYTELSKNELDFMDPSYPAIIAAKVIK